MLHNIKSLTKRMKMGRFNEFPAKIIDTIYREKPKNILGTLFNFFETRSVYLFLFLPLTIIDTAVSASIAISYAFRTFFTSDDVQEHRLARQKYYTNLFSKNFYALLASLTLIGLFAPKIITLYFVPEKRNKTGVPAGGDYYHAANAVIKEPQNIEELQEIIRNAASTGKKIMPKGAGFSQGKQFLPEHNEELFIIDLKRINTVEIHSKEKVAIVGAGALWSDIKKRANDFKLALKVMQASEVFSVGGSLGTNIHGWNIADGMLSTVVKSITIINAKGELQELTPEDRLFHNITGGMGLFGIIVSATIQLTDNELLKEKGFEVKPTNYAQHFRDTVEKNPAVRMHLYRLSIDPENLLGSGVAVNYIKEGDAPPVKDEDLRSEAIQGTRFERVMINIAQYTGFLRKKYWQNERARLLANNGPEMSINKIMQPPINALFNPAGSETRWLQEFFLPEEHLGTFLERLKEILSTNQVNLINASVRFVKQNNKSPLSYAHEGDRFAVVLCFNQKLSDDELIKAKKWIRQAQHLTVAQGGSYYLPYQHVSTPEDFKASYPYVDEAIQIKNEVDPNNLFVSGFYQKYMNPEAEKTNYFKQMMATEESRTKFSGFLKNVLYRLDSARFFKLLEDILKYCDTHEEIYTELSKRLPEIAPDALTDFLKILDSLSSIKTDLAEQAKSILPSRMHTINGLVEIGYPGRFVNGFKKNYKITGTIIAVAEEESVTDYIQTGIPRPYHRFESLDYSKPRLNNLESDSADVITCYVGLHHFEENELEAFLEEIRRVLRPDGHFLLVDHDVTNDEDMCMAHMAHSIFNIATKVPLEEEMHETRRFNSMAYWQEKLAQHGLGYAIEGPDVPMIREGDPTRNRMASFVKPGPEWALQQQKAAVKKAPAQEQNSVPEVKKATVPLKRSLSVNSFFTGSQVPVVADNDAIKNGQSNNNSLNR